MFVPYWALKSDGRAGGDVPMAMFAHEDSAEEEELDCTEEIDVKE